MSDSEFSKTYVRPDCTAVLTCPHCVHQKVIMADPFKGYKHKLKVKCSCNKIFKVFLEFRRRVRKAVFLRGTFMNHSQKGKICDLIIRDISVIGLSFTSLDTEAIKVGDELSIKFNLDDEYQTEICKDVIVRNIRRGAVGCEIETIGDLAFQGPLGRYVSSACVR
jgi:PilZ domain